MDNILQYAHLFDVGTNAPQMKMVIQIIVPRLAHYGTSYNLMETILKIIWYVHVF